MPAYATAVKRGCGKRQKGAVYAEAGIALPGEEGEPLEHFIVDPPSPVDMTAMGLTPVAVRLIERDGVWHIFDFVGEKYYPNVTDFLEEVRRFGLSRRLPKSLDFSKLTSESKIIMVHRRAWISETLPYIGDWQTIPNLNWDRCPKFIEGHVHEEFCAGFWWQDIDPKDTEVGHVFGDGRGVSVVLPSFEYAAVLRPEDHLPGYSPAIFASFPMNRLAVVNDEEGKTHVDAFGAASKAGIPTDLVED